MMEFGRGGAYVPARVAPQGRIHRSSPAHNACIGWYGNAAARTFGRAHRHRPYHAPWAAWTGVVLFIGKAGHMNQHQRRCTCEIAGLMERSKL